MTFPKTIISRYNNQLVYQWLQGENIGLNQFYFENRGWPLLQDKNYVCVLLDKIIILIVHFVILNTRQLQPINY